MSTYNSLPELKVQITDKKYFTFFDTPFRSTSDDIKFWSRRIFENKLIIQMLDGFPELAVILDSNRQIVAYNKKSESILKADKDGNISGQRLGEALRCKHAFEMPAGCGTSKFCSECGAAKSIKHTRETFKSKSDECRITILKNGVEQALDLKVFTSALKIDEQDFILFSIEDIQSEKRRKVLERIFFHDVLNTSTAIYGISEIMKESKNIDEINEFSGILNRSAQQLISEIQSQRDLTNAEYGLLKINLELKSANEIISRAFELYRDSELCKGINFSAEYLQDDVLIETDSVLLIRSIGNLIKNALEASSHNDEVKIFAELNQDEITFHVRNSAVIPAEIQLQLFQRSFSTKSASGRGIGTYSVKLLIESYLKGRVSFISNSKIGTIFNIIIPIHW